MVVVLVHVLNALDAVDVVDAKVETVVEAAAETVVVISTTLTPISLQHPMTRTHHQICSL